MATGEAPNGINQSFGHGNTTLWTGARRALEPSDLEAALRAVDPSVRLVAPRLLRRVIRQHCGLPAFRLRVPHANCYVIARQPLLEILDLPEMGWRPEELLPSRVILMERPTQEELAASDPEQVLLRYWRRLFHARIHVAFADGAAEGLRCPAALDRRIQEIGTTEFDEVRSVLEQEHLLLPGHDGLSEYIEFAATYLEFRHFAPILLANYFPALGNLDAVDGVLAQDIDGAALLAATRLQGAPDPPAASARDSLAIGGEDWDELEIVEPEDGNRGVPAGSPHSSQQKPPHGRFRRRHAEGQYRRWAARAERAATRGNLVASAIYHARAERCAPRARAAETGAAIRHDIEGLVARLQSALAIGRDESQAWRGPLLALVRETPRGIWTVEARLLYDLQKVCVDHERGVSTVDLVEWTLTLGRRSICRPLPSQREVLISKHLSSASRRLAAVRISDHYRQRLAGLLRAVAHRAEERLRDDFRPLLAATLDDVDLRPHNLPERVARNKLIEELLDRIVQRGFLNLGELRDAISRNNLKLPDVAPLGECIMGRLRPLLDARPKWHAPAAQSPETPAATPSSGVMPAIRSLLRRGWLWFSFAVLVTVRLAKSVAVWALRSDPLLRADRRLAVALDGVYQRGEFYLRWMQRFSSLAFGTTWGRRFTLYFAVPFGGAYLIVAAWSHLIDLVFGVDPRIQTNLLALMYWGFVLLGVIHWEVFRQALGHGFRILGRFLRLVFIDSVRWLIGLPILNRILRSRPVILAFRWFVKPLVPTMVLWTLMPWEGASRQASLGVGLVVFAALNLALNSRIGRNIEELVIDWAIEGWHRFGMPILTGLFWLVMDLFRGILQGVERVLYTVDEWLRFRSGEGRTSLVLKAGLGLLWFWVAYVVRFAVNVLVEPQINPIKHFPVVTVAHKILLPFIKPFGDVLAKTMDAAVAYPLATITIWSIPGIFGFLVWELKGNWRLYAANRPKDLRPVRIGSHGETMVRLLKPGFHSGTLPKRFAKLRRADRSAVIAGQSKAARKHLRELQHVEQAVRRYVEREMVELLAESPAWQQPLPCVGEVRLATNRIRVAIDLAGPAPQRLWIQFDMRGGWMLADTAPRSLATLGIVPVPISRNADGLPPMGESGPAADSSLLETAVLGLFKTAGVDLLWPQVQEALATVASRYDFTAEGIVVWPEAPIAAEALYDFHNGAQVSAKVRCGPPDLSLPAIPRSALLFRDVPITWQWWVNAWG